KNFQLAQKAIEKFSEEENVELKTVYNIKHHAVLDYITASDVVLLTSHFEGSPNVVKEAMACNIPVVSTNVGDVSDLFGDSSASYICDYTVEDVSSKISQALKYRNDFGETNGRDRIITLKMDQKSIAKKLFNVYNEIVAV
ncbi:MAG: glycosyltransferase, partial [Bacteroidota bacterium]